MVQRRVKQSDQPGLCVHQMFLHGVERHALQRGLRRTRQRAPGLGNQVNAGLRIGVAAKGLPVVKERTPEPLPVPSRAVKRRPPACCGVFPGLGPQSIAARAGERCEFSDQCAQEPAQPHRFATPLDAHAVHAVVPVTTAHQGQTVYAYAQAVVDRKGAMLKNACAVVTDGGRVVRVLGTFGNCRSVQKRHAVIEQGRVARGAQVVQGGIRQPQQVVGKMGAYPGTPRCVPPMLHVALRKLARRAQHNLLTQQVRGRPRQRHCILQLVTKSGGTASLVETGLGPQAARYRLVQQPAVDHGVEQRVGRLDRGGFEQHVPTSARQLEPIGSGHRSHLGDELVRSLGAGGIAQQENPLYGFACRQSHFDRQRRARVEPAAAALTEVVGYHQASTCVQTFAPVTGPVGCIFSKACYGQEGGAIAKTGRALLLSGQQSGELLRAHAGARNAGQHGTAIGAAGTQHPFSYANSAQILRSTALIDDPQAHLFHGAVRVHTPTRVYLDIAAPVLERAAALPVRQVVGNAAVAPGPWRDAPHFQGFAVLEQKPFRRRVRDRVVRPGGELVQSAVLRPGVTTATI